LEGHLSRRTTATSAIDTISPTPTLMLAMELSEEEWKLGFSSALGEEPVERHVRARQRPRLSPDVIFASRDDTNSAATASPARMACYAAW